MTFRIEHRQSLWCVVDTTFAVGGVFIDLAAAIRFIRRYEADARIVIVRS